MRPADRPPAGAPAPTAPAPTALQLVVIRSAMFVGVVLFGLLSWLWHQQRPERSRSEAGALLGLVVPVIAAGAVLAAFAVRARLAGLTDGARRASLKMIAWAAGESAAIAGAVHYFLTGDARYFAVGTAALLLTFVLVPARDGE